MPGFGYEEKQRGNGMPIAKIKVLAVDDHPIFIEGIASILTADPGIDFVGQAHSGTQALERYRELRPDVVLMDVQMKDGDGFEATSRILEEFPEARIVILTTYGGDGCVRRALKAGAFAYILKNALRNDLLALIRSVDRGYRTVALNAGGGNLIGSAPGDNLTMREMDVLRLVAQGQSNKRIAVLLEISEDTVKGHMKNILMKLDANDRAHAVALALQRGILPTQSV